MVSWKVGNSSGLSRKRAVGLPDRREKQDDRRPCGRNRRSTTAPSTRQLALDLAARPRGGRRRHAAGFLASPIARSLNAPFRLRSANSRSWICFSSRRGAAVLARDLVDVDHLGLDPAGMRRQQQDAVADLDRFRDRMGDEQHGEFGLAPRAAAVRPGRCAASARRARRTARPSAGYPAPSPCRARSRRAASCRRTACADRHRRRG